MINNKSIILSGLGCNLKSSILPLLTKELDMPVLKSDSDAVNLVYEKTGFYIPKHVNRAIMSMYNMAQCKVPTIFDRGPVDHLGFLYLDQVELIDPHLIPEDVKKSTRDAEKGLLEYQNSDQFINILMINNDTKMLEYVIKKDIESGSTQRAEIYTNVVEYMRAQNAFINYYVTHIKNYHIVTLNEFTDDFEERVMYLTDKVINIYKESIPTHEAD